MWCLCILLLPSHDREFEIYQARVVIKLVIRIRAGRPATCCCHWPQHQSWPTGHMLLPLAAASELADRPHAAATGRSIRAGRPATCCCHWPQHQSWPTGHMLLPLAAASELADRPHAAATGRSMRQLHTAYNEGGGDISWNPHHHHHHHHHQILTLTSSGIIDPAISLSSSRPKRCMIIAGPVSNLSDYGSN